MKFATVVTGFDRDSWYSYGQENLRRMVYYFPAGTKFVVYPWDGGCTFGKKLLAKVTVAPIPEALLKFTSSIADFKEAHGTRYDPVITPLWREKERTLGYSFRYDAIKFSKMAVQIADASRSCTTHCMLWLDADVRCFANIPDDFARHMFEQSDLVYLGRRGTHSETGFVGFQFPQALEVAKLWGELYTSSEVFKFPEWHSAYVFDVARSRVLGVRQLDLSLGKGRGHVWFSTILADYADHTKGGRKEVGWSDEAIKRVPLAVRMSREWENL